MTPEQHIQNIRQIAFKLEKADYGLGMPRDWQTVLELRIALDRAIQDYASDMIEQEARQANTADLLGRILDGTSQMARPALPRSKKEAK